MSDQERDPLTGNTQETNPPQPKPAPKHPTPSPANGSKVWMIASLVLAVVLIVVLIKPPFAKGGSNEVVATVNGEEISKDRLYNQLAKSGGKQILDSLIAETLVNQEAKKKNIQVSQADTDKALADIRKNYSSDQEFQAALAQNGLSMDELKTQMNTQVRLRKILEPEVKVTDEDIKKYFDENKASFDTPEQVQASHILVAKKEDAEAILKELQGGADFAKLAKEKSIDPGSKEKGGDLGFFGRGTMYKEFEDAAFGLKKDGELSPIVKTEKGYHIIKRTGYKAAVVATLDQKKAEIKERLTYQGVMQKAQTWLADLKAKAKITNNLEQDLKKNSDKQATTTEKK